MANKKPTPPTLDAVLKGLLDKVREQDDAEGLTSTELQELWGLGRAKTLRSIVRLREVGLLGVRQVQRPSPVNDRPHTFTLYFPTQPDA